MKTVNLFFLTDNNYGGWVTFTLHLAKAFEAMGWAVRIFCLGRHEDKHRDFGYGLVYQNVELPTACALAKEEFSIVTAMSAKHFHPELLAAGAWLVLHDPTELKGAVTADALRAAGAHIITIRKRVHEFLASSACWLPNVFIPHPYVRAGVEQRGWHDRPFTGCSLSRIDFDKNILIIGEANKLLDEEHKVNMWGFDCRVYAHWKLDKVCPTWRERYYGKYPHEWAYGVKLAQDHKFLVDLSTIAGDGDGTQYTFLEGWDAGCALVVNKGWLQKKDSGIQHGVSALAVATPEELAAIMRSRIDYTPLVRAGQEILSQHAPQVIIPQYAALLGS